MSGLTVSLIFSLIIGLFSVSGYTAVKKRNTTLQPNYTGKRSQRTEIPQIRYNGGNGHLPVQQERAGSQLYARHSPFLWLPR